jgi:hypothetical protein
MTDAAAKWSAFDSSVLILFLNDALAALHVQTLNDALDAGRGQISAVVRAEVLAWSGHTSLSLGIADEFLDAFHLVPVDAAVANEAARIRREHGLKMPDALIAATALLQSATLVTANARDFRRVPALRLVDV